MSVSSAISGVVVASSACALVIAALAVVIVIILSQLDGDTDDVIADFFHRTSL